MALATVSSTFAVNDFALGVGMHDITGPAAGVVMMGYVNPVQITKVSDAFHICFCNVRIFPTSVICEKGDLFFINLLLCHMILGYSFSSTCSRRSGG